MLREYRNDRFPILLYHRFVPTSADLSRYPGTESIFTVTADQFESQLSSLRRNGFQSVGAPQVVSFVTQGRALPAKPVMISVDDGWRSNIDIMLPLLEKHGFGCTIFVTTGHDAWIFKKFKGLDRGLTPDEVSDLHSRGITIGAHTVSHPYLIELSDGEICREFIDSKTALEEWIHGPCVYLSIPGNFYNRRVANLARKCGYEAVFTANVGTVSRRSDPFDINRLIVEGAFSLREFEANLRPFAIMTRKGIAWAKQQPPIFLGASRYMALREVLFNSPLRHLFIMRRLKTIAACGLSSVIGLAAYWWLR